MKRKYTISFLIILGIFFGNCQNKKAEEIEREKVVNGLLVKVLTNNKVTSSVVNVSSSCRTGYTTLVSSMSACAGCHATTPPVIKDTEDSFNAVVRTINPSEPATSQFYTALTTGKMVGYSGNTGALQTEILNWITSCKP